MGGVLMVSVSGMRGIVGDTMTPEIAARFAGAAGAFLRAKGRAGRDTRTKVLLARDGRAGGAALADAAAAGLAAAGCDVLDLGVAMTPTAGFMVDQLRAAGALVVTASHNPQEWNGLKVIAGVGRGVRAGVREGVRAGACAPPRDEAEAIIERFRGGAPAGAPWKEVGARSAIEGAAAMHAGHVAGLMRALGVAAKIRRSGFRVVVDSVNASGSAGARALLGGLGCRVIGSACDASGIFPHAPEPIGENLGALRRAVRRGRAAAGFAQDPDADRLAIVDERGRFIGEEYTLVLAARALGRLGGIRRGTSLCVNLSTSRMIEDAASEFGARVVRAAVGEANVVEAMKRERSPLGGEGNGGVIWPRVTFVRDSLGAMALCLALMAMEKRPLSAIVDAMPAYAIVKRKVPLESREGRSSGSRAAGACAPGGGVARAFAGEPGSVDHQDGVRVDLPARRAWVHVRASNTEPILRLIAEAPTRADAEELLDRAAAGV